MLMLLANTRHKMFGATYWILTRAKRKSWTKTSWTKTYLLSHEITDNLQNSNFCSFWLRLLTVNIFHKDAGRPRKAVVNNRILRQNLKTVSSKCRINMVTRSFLLFAISVTLNLSCSATQSPVKMRSKFTLWLSNVRTGGLPSSLFSKLLPSAYDCQINTNHSVPEILPRTNGSLRTSSQSFPESTDCFGPEKWGLYHFLAPAKLKGKTLRLGVDNNNYTWPGSRGYAK